MKKFGNLQKGKTFKYHSRNYIKVQNGTAISIRGSAQHVKFFETNQVVDESNY